jgi:hypothetical protein
MQDVITRLVDVPFARMFVLAGIVFLLVAVLGKVEGKIDPGNMGRVGASILGAVLLVVGVVLQYIEIRDLGLERAAIQAHLQNQGAGSQTTTTQTTTTQTMTTGAAEKQSGVAATLPDKPSLKIVSGTYGRGCNAKPGNATQALAKACDGKSSCDYAVEPVEIEDAPSGCARDFAAEWKCGSGNAVYSAILPASAGRNEKLHLECAR